MGDPRWNIPDKRLPTVRFDGTGTTDPADKQQTLTETERRLKLALEKTNPPLAAAILPQQQVPSIPNIPGATAIDRWHKFGLMYVTVSNRHLVNQDPDLDNSAFATITEGYAFAKTLWDSFQLIYPNGRVIVEVHSGIYNENIVCDHSHIDLCGIGMPIIRVENGSIAANNCIKIDALCTKIRIEGFRFDNAAMVVMSAPLWKENAGLRIDPGVESGSQQSDIKIVKCDFTGGYTQIYAQRWAYFENCQTFPQAGAVSIGSVMIQFPIAIPQTHWTVFFDCHLRGYTNGADFRNRGDAITIQALDDTIIPNLWVPNIVTFGTALWSRTGVYLDHCEIDGYSENWGWCMEYYHCFGIEGHFINGTSGSYHHGIFSNSDQGVNAYTWLNHSRVGSRYVAHPIDVSLAGTGGTSTIWLSHFKHTAPDGPPVVQAGTSIWNTVAPIAAAIVWVDHSDTHAIAFYDIGGGEIANLLNSNADPTNVLQPFYQQGYLNV